MRNTSRFRFTVSVVLAIGLATISCRFAGDPGLRPAPGSIVASPVARTLPPLPLKPLTPDMEAMRARTMAVASRLRELDFQNDVGMVVLSGWEYGARSSETAELLGGDDLRALSRLAVAGGILPQGTDLATLAAAYAAVSTSASYSPLDKRVILVDKFSGDSQLTHEFVHALQDQHFDLLKLLMVRPFDFDRMEALFAVIEGDAMTVQHRADEGDAYSRRRLDERRTRFDDHHPKQAPIFTALLIEAFKFRYLDGERFVETVRKTRGEAGVDNLFINPPTSSQQILHPEKYLANIPGPDVSLDDKTLNSQGWKLSTSTSLGEIGMRGIFLADPQEPDATKAAAAWRGDRAFLFERPGSEPLFIWKTVWDSHSAAEEFVRRYSRLLVSGSNPPTISKKNADTWEIRDGLGGLTLAQRDRENLIVVRGAESDVRDSFKLLIGLEFVKE